MGRTEDARRQWAGEAGGWSAYSKANGGMCENATDFWTDEAAMVAFDVEAAPPAQASPLALLFSSH